MNLTLKLKLSSVIWRMTFLWKGRMRLYIYLHKKLACSLAPLETVDQVY